VGNSGENPEVTGPAVGAASDGEDVSQAPTQPSQAAGTLPTIGKHGGVSIKNTGSVAQGSDGPGATSGPFRSLDNPGSVDEEDFDSPDAMVLPPIGGLKGGQQKASMGPGVGASKTHGAKPPRAVKVGAGAALQKARGESGTYGGGDRQGGQQFSQSGASSSSKGFAGGNASSMVGPSQHISMSSTYGKKFGGTQAGSNLGASASTLNQTRKYATGSSSMPPPQRGHGHK
jgi:hypothetical protein